MYPHAEACVLHGVQLARMRPKAGKPLVAASFSFTRFLRNWRSAQALRSELVKFVRDHLVIEEARRPATLAEHHAHAVNVLFGQREVTEDRPESSFRRDVRTLLDVVSFSQTHLTHPCSAPGPGPHQKCCRTPEESVEKVTVAMLNVLLSRAWVVGGEGKWTHTMETLSRELVGYMLKGALPACLDNLQHFWGVSPSLEAQLAAQVDANDPNHECHRKLRLVRICKTMCQPGVSWQLAVLVTGLRVLDDFMYLVFGAHLEQRPSLLDLLGLRTPRFAEMQAKFRELLQDFAPGVSWIVLQLAGGDFQDGSVRRFARANLFQLSASLVEHFELKWSQPPYSLLPLLEDDVPLGEKRRRARSFLQDRPAECLSLFLRRLRANFPSVPSLLGEGVAALRSWNSSVVLGIDVCERSHYLLRLQLRSTSSARNATTSANTAFLQQVAADHQRRHECRPFRSLANVIRGGC